MDGVVGAGRATCVTHGDDMPTSVLGGPCPKVKCRPIFFESVTGGTSEGQDKVLLSWCRTSLEHSKPCTVEVAWHQQVWEWDACKNPQSQKTTCT